MSITYLEAIREAQARALADDPRVFIYGQDIGAFGGAFKATKNLAKEFPGRVIDSPISEDAIVGLAVGEAVLHVRYRNTAKGVFRQARSWAQYSVLMYKRYRTPGTREYWRWRQNMKEWTHLLRKIRDFDQHWLRLLGWQIGKLIGSLKYRVPPI